MEGLNTHNRRIGSSCLPWTRSRNENQEYKRMPALVLRNKEVPKVKEYIIMLKDMSKIPEGVRFTRHQIARIQAARRESREWNSLSSQAMVSIFELEAKLAREAYIKLYLQKKSDQYKLYEAKLDNQETRKVQDVEFQALCNKAGKFVSARELNEL